MVASEQMSLGRATEVTCCENASALRAGVADALHGVADIWDEGEDACGEEEHDCHSAASVLVTAVEYQEGPTHPDNRSGFVQSRKGVRRTESPWW